MKAVRRILNIIYFCDLLLLSLYLYDFAKSEESSRLGYGIVVVALLAFMFVAGSIASFHSRNSFSWGDNLEDIVKSSSKGDKISAMINTCFSVLMAVISMLLLLYKYYTDFL